MHTTSLKPCFKSYSSRFKIMSYSKCFNSKAHLSNVYNFGFFLQEMLAFPSFELLIVAGFGSESELGNLLCITGVRFIWQIV